MGQCRATSSASAVYLGNGWAITANHVSEASVRLSDGRDFGVAPDSAIVLSNPTSSGLTGNADLRMFRLDGDPGLPTVPIGATVPTSGSQVMMIGAGRDRANKEIGWQVTSSSVWTPVGLPVASVRGFDLLSTASMRWGESRISGSPTLNNGTISLTTNFSLSSGPFAAQATVGDSGGGMFQQVHGAWQLVGIIDAQQLMANQPSDTVVFGDSSLSASMAAYHDEILKIMDAPLPAWQNPYNYYDVDRNGTVDSRDLLLLIHEVSTKGGYLLTGTPGANSPLVDVNGDGEFSLASDVLPELHFLQGIRKTVPSASGLGFVPEPSSLVLAVCGAVALAAVHWRRRRARR